MPRPALDQPWSVTVHTLMYSMYVHAQHTKLRMYSYVLQYEGGKIARFVKHLFAQYSLSNDTVKPALMSL